MEKILELYKIPNQEDIVNLIALDEEPPVFEEGDYYADRNDDAVYQAQAVGGVLQWVQVYLGSDKYIMYKGDGWFWLDNATFDEMDFSFPSKEWQGKIYSFNYGASRMGGSPTISGTVMHRTCLDELWTDRVCVYFNKTFHFIDKIPTSEYSNADERYKHSVEFVSERLLLEKVYFMNVVDAENANTDVPVSQWLNFTVSDTISDFVGRLNESLEYSGLQDIGFRVVVDTDQYTTDFINAIEEKYKLLTISETTLKEALDLIYSNWEVPYWFDGYTVHVGFSNKAIMPDGVEMPTFQYGSTDSLLSIQKSQSNDIINRITGLGSSDNLPHFYPNKNPIGGVLRYMRNQTLMVDYARIANPYRLAGINITDDVHGDTPNGTYFKYMPITKTHTFDQFLSVNPFYKHQLSMNDGDVSLVQLQEYAYDIRVKYKVQSVPFQAQNMAVKLVWIWLKEGSNRTLSIKDFWRMPIFEDGEITGWGDDIMAEYKKGYVFAKSYNKTHDEFVNAAESVNSVNVYDYYNLVSLQYEVQNGSVVWSDGETTETYEDRMPITTVAVQQNHNCVLVAFGRRFVTKEYNLPDDYNGGLIPYLESSLKNCTNATITETYVSTPEWSKNADGHSVNLYRYYGIKINSNITPQNGDVIYFERDGEYLPSSSSLIPYRFRETGDIWLNALNNEYHKEGSQSEYYVFENLYKTTFAREGVSNHEDIKPTIKGMSNNSIPSRRIDRIRAVAFDQDDNNDVAADGTTYQHPYFYVKLAKTSLNNGYGFNLFDCAIDGATMQLSFTSGKCSGCKFEVMVKYGSDGMARNPIALFTEPTTINGITYPAGTPKRDSDGNVMTNQYQAEQQDTSAQEVWIALKKDTETFSSGYSGSDIPNSSSVYPDLSRVKIPTTSDDFVLLNINLPYAYVIAAEKKLYYALLDDLQEQNKRVFGFSIKFSSIYYKKNYEFMDKWLNESSLVPFIYDGNELEYYVQSYAYKVTDGKLPEVTIELQERLRRVVSPAYPLYPTRFNPYLSSPFTQNATEKMIRRIVNETLEAKDKGVHSAEFNDVQIHGDITMQDGTSLNSQIVAINSQIFANEKIRTKEFAWGEVSRRAEIENLFVDGVFATDYNEYDTTKVRIIPGGQGAVGNNCINAVFEDSVSYFSFKQKLAVEELTSYTFAFYVKSSNGSSVDVTITQYDGQGNILDSTVVNIGLGQDWAQKAVSFDTLQDAEYIVAKIANGGEETAVSVYIDGVSLYADNYTAFDQNGNPVINSMLPSKYKMSTADIFNAIDKLGTKEIVWCTYTETDSTNHTGTMSMTIAEIQAAVNAGNMVCLKQANNVFVLSDIGCFSRVVGGNVYRYQNFSNNEIWHYFVNTLQQELVSGTNIKTINGNSVLGSGNLTTFPAKYVIFKSNATGNTITPGTGYNSNLGDLNTISIHHITGSQQSITISSTISTGGLTLKIVVDNSSNTNVLTISTLNVYLGGSYVTNKIFSPSLQTTSGWEIQAGGMAEFEITADSNIAVIKRNF